MSRQAANATHTEGGGDGRDVSLVGDSQDTLRAHIPLLERKTDRKWRAAIEGGGANVAQGARGPRPPTRKPAQPAVCLLRVEQAPSRSVHYDLGLGIGNELVGTVHRHPAGHAGVAIGHAGHHVPGVPYAIGAKFAFPGPPVIAFTGDGVVEMLGMRLPVVPALQVQSAAGKSAAVHRLGGVDAELDRVSVMLLFPAARRRPVDDIAERVRVTPRRAVPGHPRGRFRPPSWARHIWQRESSLVSSHGRRSLP